MPGGKHALGMNKGRHIFGTVRVGEKGQIVIPRDARRLFGIEAGDTLLVLGDEENGLLVTKPDVMNEVAARILSRFDEPAAEEEDKKYAGE